mmetsp:Transcript_154267/g.494700  ORF Transcript_154267/g.494700 Transcript_154267/m.494700 type:complete len:278 (+) Transcript_154267:795-1628(+)
MRLAEALGTDGLQDLGLERPQLLHQVLGLRASATRLLLQQLQALVHLDLPGFQRLRLVVSLGKHGGLLLGLELFELLHENPTLSLRLIVLRVLEELLPHLRARLVHDVDGLVWQEAVGDVLRGQLHRGNERPRRVAQLVVTLVLRRETLQDLHCLLLRGLWHIHRLKAALESRILLDVLAVLLDGGRADDLQLAAGQGRLHDVAGVHGAAAIPGAAGTDNGVDLVDHQDDLFLGCQHLVDHILQTLLELTSVAGARQQHREVQLHDALALQKLGHIA